MAGNKDEQFLARIRSGIATVEAWDADPSLLAECRLMIPFDRLMPESQQEKSPYFRDNDFLYQGNALFLKRLTLFFQKEVMTWVSAPPCEKCGGDTECKGTRGPISQEEREGRADRVEVYHCKSCEATTNFPRYNSVRKLLEFRKGRCGEYANLFGLYCRAAGFETRYVLDWTDHVWIEVLVGDEWIMADSCEGLINVPSMYESGWGKQLNCVVGMYADAVMDVTPRYTRKFHDKDFQERRRNITPSEASGDRVIAQVNSSMRQGLSTSRAEELDRRANRERSELETCKSTSDWTEAEKHGRGRISGSREWKMSRHEAGKSSEEESSPSTVRGLFVEQFYPTGQVEISVFPRNQAGIIVSGADCDVGQSGCISLVVVDDVHLGCVLQCRSFAAWADLGDFLTTIPSNRIVVLRGSAAEEQLSESTKENMELLGGFKLPDKSEEGIIFVGQVEAHPEWTICTSYSESRGVSVKFPPKERASQKLRAERDTVSYKVAARLPESQMPLQTQLLATETQKRSAFLSYAKEKPQCVGYTTKDGCPIYLLENTSFSFRKAEGWNTFHYLPEALAQESDGGIVVSGDKLAFDIPLDEDFFTSLFGPLLLGSSGSSLAAKASNDALHNTRLVGLYFSAHWCPPCRRFTPMLIEAYNHLKDEFPSHGLEIVFVSSDRSDAEFNQYYASMPWAAVPYDANRTRQKEISMRYGVRGIPGLVILDSMSGQIVASAEQSRTEVVQACQRGEKGIEAMMRSWLDRIPDDSKELVSMLELSCGDGDENATAASKSDNPYLIRMEAKKKPEPFDPSARVKEIFAKCVANGEEPNTAAAKAIKLVNEMEHRSSYGKGALNEGSSSQIEPSNGRGKTDDLIARIKVHNPYSEDILQLILRTLSKYLGNAAREPWNPKFRNLKLSNKIVDRVARVEGTLDLICSFGMSVVATSQDFVVTIPLAVDVNQIGDAVSKALVDAAAE